MQLWLGLVTGVTVPLQPTAAVPLLLKHRLGAAAPAAMARPTPWLLLLLLLQGGEHRDLWPVGVPGWRGAGLRGCGAGLLRERVLGLQHCVGDVPGRPDPRAIPAVDAQPGQRVRGVQPAGAPGGLLQPLPPANHRPLINQPTCVCGAVMIWAVATNQLTNQFILHPTWFRVCACVCVCAG